MNDILFWLVALISGWYVMDGIFNTRKVYRFPFLFTVAIVVWILPTAYIARSKQWIIGQDVYSLTMLNTLLCLLAGLMGYFFVKSPHKLEPLELDCDADKLFHYSLPFWLLGVGASLYLFRIGPSVSEWRGMPVYVLFVARFLRPALLVVLVSTLLRPSTPKWIASLVAISIPLFSAAVYLRRSDVFFTMVLVGMALFLVRGYIAPRLAIPSLVVSSFLVVVLFPAFRQPPGSSELFSQKVNSREVVSGYLSGERTNEFLESALTMDAVRKAGKYGLGVGFINQFVQQYVPRGLVGTAAKEALKFEDSDLEAIRESQGDGGFKFYLAPTGFSQAYFEFGWFGCLLFFLIGWVIGKLERSAFQRKSTFWLLFYAYVSVLVPFSVYGTLVEIPTLLVPVVVTFWFVTWKARRFTASSAEKFANA